MSDAKTPEPGTIGWMDLTVKDAVAIGDFYAKVVGWSTSPVDMGGYEDFCMNPPGAAWSPRPRRNSMRPESSTKKSSAGSPGR